MRPFSIQVRLTVWYVAVLAVTTFLIIAGSWWLVRVSVIRVTDASLRARVEGVRTFLENPDTILTVNALQDEFREYAELTRGEALLAVVDTSGIVLCRPAIRGWNRLETDGVHQAISEGVQPLDRRLDGSPYRVANNWIEARGRTYHVTVAAPMRSAEASIRRFHGLLMLLAPFSLLIAAAGGAWVSRRALAPVDRIITAVQTITLDRLDRRLDVPAANDELRRLALTFNDMLVRLQAAVGEMVRFTADASHELRTPVTLVRTTAELVLRHERPGDEYRNALEEVLAYSQHMTELVDDLLVLARTDAGIEVAEPTAIDLTEVAYEATREIAAAARAQSVHVRLDAPDAPSIVMGDQRSLRRLLMILLDNAVKYTPPGGDVRVRLHESTPSGDQRAAVSISVTDSGIGLDSADLPRLFERFYRGVRARQCAPDGTGLGLAIARKIVDRHHGSITLGAADAYAVPCGCRAEVFLPLARDTASVPPVQALFAEAANVH